MKKGPQKVPQKLSGVCFLWRSFLEHFPAKRTSRDIPFFGFFFKPSYRDREPGNVGPWAPPEAKQGPKAPEKGAPDPPKGRTKKVECMKSVLFIRF